LIRHCNRSFTDFCGHSSNHKPIGLRAAPAAENPLRGPRKVIPMKKAMLALGVMASLAGSAQAALLFSIAQVGADVVVTGSGSLNLGSVDASTGPGSGTPWVYLNMNSIGVGPTGAGNGYTVYPTSETGGFGGGSYFPADSASGDLFGFAGLAGPYSLMVPSGYVSGAALSGSATYNNKTLADLGFTAGDSLHVSWGTSPNTDSFTATVVPEPHQYAMVAGLGLVGIGLWRRHARK
jgi:hypothetical protein